VAIAKIETKPHIREGFVGLGSVTCGHNVTLLHHLRPFRKSFNFAAPATAIGRYPYHISNVQRRDRILQHASPSTWSGLGLAQPPHLDLLDHLAACQSSV
jgi:hypothetical protein